MGDVFVFFYNMNQTGAAEAVNTGDCLNEVLWPLSHGKDHIFRFTLM